MAAASLRIGFCEGVGGAAVWDEVIWWVTWPRTELRGQVTHRPARAGSRERERRFCGASIGPSAETAAGSLRVAGDALIGGQATGFSA